MSRNRLGQPGFVSIFAVLIIMSVLTLIAVGFASVTRNAERRTLDNQLNTQAFYAAESGVHDAERYIDDASIADHNKTECQNVPGSFKYNYDATLGVGYSCVLIDESPPNYYYSFVPVMGVAEPIVVPFRTDNPTFTLKFQWDDATTGNSATLPAIADGFGMSASNSPVLKTSTQWGSRVGILRVDLIPEDYLDRANLVERSYTFFLYPLASGGVVGSLNALNGVSNKAGTRMTTCNQPGALRCSAEIRLRTNYTTGGDPIVTRYIMRLQSYYNPVKVDVSAYDTLGTQMEMREGQALIDSTGRANDIFRRIQVRRPIRPIPGVHESLALTSIDSICKRIMVSEDRVTYDTSALGGAAATACDPGT